MVDADVQPEGAEMIGIISIDFETIPNPAALAMMPDPEVRLGNVKDPAKVAAKIEEAKAAQVEKAALDPLTARIASYAIVGETGGKRSEYCEVIDAEADDEGEIKIVQSVMEVLGKPETRIITFNGVYFDMPMIYRRAMILGVDPRDFQAPPLTAWTSRYKTDRHYDIGNLWYGWGPRQKGENLDRLAAMVLGARKVEFDVTTIKDLITTDEGRAALEEYNLQDARITYDLWLRGLGVLYS